MKSIREKFEEIWPVPEQIEWDDEFGQYLGDHELRFEHNARLDTFTRCQEKTSMYVGLIEELVDELEKAQDWISNSTQCATVGILLSGAKRALEQSK
ncbi:hypothetical protein D3C77_427920 [compost metagenome]